MTLVSCLCLLVAATPTAAAPKEKLVVLPPQTSGVEAHATAILGELLVDSVRRLGDYEVLGKSDLDAMLGLENLKDQLGCDDTACAAQLGGALGASRLVTGRIAKLGNALIIVLKVIDANEQKVLNSVKHKAVDDPTAYDFEVDTAVAKLFGKPLPKGTGRVLATPSTAETTEVFQAAGNDPNYYALYQASGVELPVWTRATKSSLYGGMGSALLTGGAISTAWGILLLTAKSSSTSDRGGSFFHVGGVTTALLGGIAILAGAGARVAAHVTTKKLDDEAPGLEPSFRAMRMHETFQAMQVAGIIGGSVSLGMTVLCWVMITLDDTDWRYARNAGVLGTVIGGAGIIAGTVGMAMIDLTPSNDVELSASLAPLLIPVRGGETVVPGLAIGGAF